MLTNRLPDKVLAVAAEGGLLEKTGYELMTFDLLHVLLSQSPPPLHSRALHGGRG
jgi:hypothetical protein